MTKRSTACEFFFFSEGGIKLASNKFIFARGDLGNKFLFAREDIGNKI